MTMNRRDFVRLAAGAVCLPCGVGNGDDSGDENEAKRFEQLCGLHWREVFFDPCTEDWHEHWTLDGLNARISNGPQGMDVWSGPERQGDESHAVLWTKNSFTGDIRIDYEYTKLDHAIAAVTVLYIQGAGNGNGGHDWCIFWPADKRAVARTRLYFDHMNLDHIRYAAFPANDNIPDRPCPHQRLEDLEPGYLRTGIFEPNLPHRITVFKHGDDLFMRLRHERKQMLCHWHTDEFPPVHQRRIGLRHMWRRGARYRGFRVCQLQSG